MKLIILILLICNIATLCSACITPQTTEDTCLYGSTKIGDDQSNVCRIVNSNPFNYPAPGDRDRDECNTLIRTDGEECIELYAKFQCSTKCGLCDPIAKKVCKSLCDDVKTKCPGAFDGDCFSAISFSCKTDNNDCTNWNVDTSQLPTPIDGGTTTTTTTTPSSTTTSSTTTTTGGSSAANNLSIIHSFIFVVVLVWALS